MSNLEDSINNKLLNIENSLVNILDLVDYKKLCEEQLGYVLDQSTIKEFITKYNDFLNRLCEIRYEKEDNAFINGVPVMLITFMLAIFSLLFINSCITFFGIIILGYIVYCILKTKKITKCKHTESKLKEDYKSYCSNLPYDNKVISIMEDIVYDYYGKFKYPYDFYKELYLRLK